MLTKDLLSDCKRAVIQGINYLADSDLRRDDIPLSTKLGAIGIGPQDCAIIERNVNSERRYKGREPVDEGTITVATTISAVVTYVCG